MTSEQKTALAAAAETKRRAHAANLRALRVLLACEEDWAATCIAHDGEIVAGALTLASEIQQCRAYAALDSARKLARETRIAVDLANDAMVAAVARCEP